MVHWSRWKRLYKQADDVEILGVTIVHLDVSTRVAAVVPIFDWALMPPGGATMAYMVRWARRYMRGLAERDPEAYVALALRVLGGSKGRVALDPLRRWASFDISHPRPGAAIGTFLKDAQAYAAGYLAYVGVVSPDRAASFVAAHPWLGGRGEPTGTAQ